MATKKTQDDFSDDNAVKSNWVKFNVIQEDKVVGTLIRVSETDSQFNPGEKVKIYELKADYGSFHELDDRKKLIDEPITIGEGEFWSVGGKAGIDKQMANIKIGQKVGFKFVDEMPNKTKGFAPAKLIKVYAPKNDDGTPKMDLEFIEKNNSVDDQAF